MKAFLCSFGTTRGAESDWFGGGGGGGGGGGRGGALQMAVAMAVHHVRPCHFDELSGKSALIRRHFERARALSPPAD